MATKDIAVDPLHEEFFVVADSANAVDVYSLEANGTPVAKLRSITGSATALNAPSGIVYNPEQDELLVSNGGDGKVLVFNRGDSGNVAPKRNVSLL